MKKKTRKTDHKNRSQAYSNKPFHNSITRRNAMMLDENCVESCRQLADTAMSVLQTYAIPCLE